MNSLTIQQCFEEKQVSLPRECNLIQISEVFCPMCEVRHENNTNCQRND